MYLWEEFSFFSEIFVWREGSPVVVVGEDGGFEDAFGKELSILILVIIGDADDTGAEVYEVLWGFEVEGGGIGEEDDGFEPVEVFGLLWED